MLIEKDATQSTCKLFATAEVREKYFVLVKVDVVLRVTFQSWYFD